MIDFKMAKRRHCVARYGNGTAERPHEATRFLTKTVLVSLLEESHVDQINSHRGCGYYNARHNYWSGVRRWRLFSLHRK